MRTNVWEDDFYLLQRKYGRGIYSHDTALYLLGYSDRTPARYTMTFPKGYHSPSLEQENINVRRVVPENFSLGIMELHSPCGNPVLSYNLERTLCDILRGSGSDIQIVNAAMKKYALSKEKDIHKLQQYAQQLRVKPKVLETYPDIIREIRTSEQLRGFWKNISAILTMRKIFLLMMPVIRFSILWIVCKYNPGNEVHQSSPKFTKKFTKKLKCNTAENRGYDFY